MSRPFCKRPRRCRWPKEGRPCSSWTTTSPSSTRPSYGRPRIARATSGKVGVRSFPLRLIRSDSPSARPCGQRALLHLGLDLCRARQVVHVQSGVDRVVRIDGGPAPIHMLILLLDQEPVVRARLRRVHERPQSLHFVAPQLEQELPLREAGGDVLDGHPRSFVPHDRGSGAVLPLRNHTLELGVVERMRFHVHGEPLVRGIGRWPFGHRPRLQRPFPLQPQVLVQVAGVVLVQHEELAGGGCGGTERLGGAARGSACRDTARGGPGGAWRGR